ncbi:MAG: LPS export ABC transporter permease LptG [Desulfobacteraceae bacterium]|nr:LPS export ABC transporter permease LptG [Desulfobacteraceae bacterium]
MTILTRYICSEIGKIFVIILAVVIGIYVVVDFFEKIDDFIEKSVPIYKAFVFLLFKIPFIVAQILPVCVLLSVLIAFGLMNKNNEIIALKSSGVGLATLFKPVLVLGFVASIALFFLSEVIVPIAMGPANDIWYRDVRNERAVLSEEKNIWIKGHRSISHIQYYDAVRKTAFHVTFNRFDAQFRLLQRIDAAKGVFVNGRWSLTDVIEQQLDRTDGSSDVTFHGRMALALDFTPDDLQRLVKKSEEMNYAELRRYIQKVESEGYDATHYRVDLQAKIAFPFICVIMTLVGTGIALRANLREGLPVAIAYGLGVTFLYWIFYSFCVSLGYGEMMPPWTAVWTANLVFTCFGAYLLLSLE